jgi:lysophospholipid acyltransferase (LPLAT)-like uncharacterized protein
MFLVMIYDFYLKIFFLRLDTQEKLFLTPYTAISIALQYCMHAANKCQTKSHRRQLEKLYLFLLYYWHSKIAMATIFYKHMNKYALHLKHCNN